MFNTYLQVQEIRKSNRKAVCAAVCLNGYHVEAYRDDTRAFVEVTKDGKERIAEIDLSEFDELSQRTELVNIGAYSNTDANIIYECFKFLDDYADRLQWQRKRANNSGRMCVACAL